MRSKVTKTVSVIFISVIILSAVVLTPQAFGWSTWTVTGSSMKPSYYNGDLLIGKGKRGVFNDKRGAINNPVDSTVVIVKTGTWKTDAGNIVKRVIASHGDKITIDRQGRIHKGSSVNDPLVDKRENDYDSGCEVMDGKQDGKTITIPSGKVFVRGDNVSVSADSRHAFCQGEKYLVDVSDVEAIVTAVIPLGRLSVMVTGGVD